MNQRRYIERQNKLTEIEIDDIKRRIRTEVNIQNSQERERERESSC